MALLMSDRYHKNTNHVTMEVWPQIPRTTRKNLEYSFTFMCTVILLYIYLADAFIQNDSHTIKYRRYDYGSNFGYLAQGYFDMLAAGAGDQTTDSPIRRRPLTDKCTPRATATLGCKYCF